MKTIKILFLMSISSVSLTAQSANVQTVMAGYAFFGQGDIGGILNLLSDDIVWVHAGDPSIVPFGGVFKGKAGVGHFFGQVTQSSQITVFQPSNFREQGNMVINEIHIEGVAIPTGKSMSIEATITWTFDDNGKAVRWEAHADMTAAEAAFAE